MLLDKNRIVIDANLAARDVFGDHLAGRDLAHSLRHPLVLDAATKAVSGAVSGALSDASKSRLEFAMQVPVDRRFELHAMPVQPGRFGACCAVLVLLDVTATHQVEQMRADFVANVSHELRSPLAALSGFIETLQGPAKNDEPARERFLTIMLGEAHRMARLIDDLLSLSRVQSQEHIRPREKIDLTRLLANVCELVQLRGAGRGISVELVCPGSLPAIAGDADQLQEVFLNLLDNAIKYGVPDAKVTVKAQIIARLPDTGAAGVSISVHNQGAPIEPEHLPRLTERFYRADKARSREIGGTGLGLAIVKHILNRHRGRLLIESTAQSGTTCTVLLPQVESAVT